MSLVRAITLHGQMSIQSDSSEAQTTEKSVLIIILTPETVRTST